MFARIDLTDFRRVFFVGDLHGDWKAFNYFLESVGFTYRDAIVSVGDLIDRGNYNIEVVNFFLFSDNAFAVRGNHEDMAIRGVLGKEPNQAAGWISNGGAWMLEYPTPMIDGMLRCMAQDMPVALQVHIGNAKIGVVHAECPIDDWETFGNQLHQYAPWQHRAIWGRNNIEGNGLRNIKNIDFVISGHSVKSGVTEVGNQIWIDTGSVFDRGDNKYGLTIAEWQEGGFAYHRVWRDTLAPKKLAYDVF